MPDVKTDDGAALLSHIDSRSELLMQLLAAQSALHECCLKFIII